MCIQKWEPYGSTSQQQQLVSVFKKTLETDWHRPHQKVVHPGEAQEIFKRRQGWDTIRRPAGKLMKMTTKTALNYYYYYYYQRILFDLCVISNLSKLFWSLVRWLEKRLVLLPYSKPIMVQSPVLCLVPVVWSLVFLLTVQTWSCDGPVKRLCPTTAVIGHGTGSLSCYMINTRCLLFLSVKSCRRLHHTVVSALMELQTVFIQF